MKAKKYLKGGQVKLDANKDGKISGKDFSMLRKGMKKYQKGGKAPEGEINLGSTIASKKRMTLGEAEEMNRRTTKNYGKDPASIRSGYASMDRRLDEAEQSRREARARAGNKYYDGDGGGAARREKAYADELEARSYAKMAGEKVDAYREKSKKERAEKGLKAVDTYNKSTAKMKKGGKVVKYQEGGKSVRLPEVVVTGKKGKGLRERTVVGRGMSGEDYTKRRSELQAEYTDAYYTKNNRKPGTPISAIDKSMIADKVRMQLQKEGMTERGVTSKETGKRLSPEMEQQYRDRTNRR
jgi:hypothetical protein